jgi:dGTP triphosphohydrolase
LVSQDYLSFERRKGRSLLPPRLDAYLKNTFGKEEFAFYESDEKRIRRAVADYIASLTDNQAIDLYGRLHGLTTKSILDSWIHN